MGSLRASSEAKRPAALSRKWAESAEREGGGGGGRGGS